jgi:phosphopantothenoylcysteine decarboxylase/phosphopantothenate--cysteine ligase
MGIAIASEAAHRGADVTLVAGPTTLEMPAVRRLVRVRSAIEMHKAVMDEASHADVVVMAAAVADYQPLVRADEKVKKTDADLTIVLRRTPDILEELGRRRLASGGSGPILVGFAAETADVMGAATAKRNAKHVDLIVANDVSRADAGFDVETNAVTIVGPDGVESLPLQSKAKVAALLLDRIEHLVTAATERHGS